MFKSKNTFYIYKVWLQWTSATLIGWVIIKYFGFDNRNLIMSSWHIVFQTLTAIFVNGLLLGALVGLLQFTFLSDDLRLTKWWIFIQACSYSIGSTVGLLSVIVFVWMFNPGLFTQATIVFPFPLPLTMLISGGLVGLIQIVTLKSRLGINLSRAMLYLVSSSLAWGLSFFSINYLNKNSSIYIQNSIAGVVIGTITGLVIFLLLKDEDKLRISATENFSTN